MALHNTCLLPSRGLRRFWVTRCTGIARPIAWWVCRRSRVPWRRRRRRRTATIDECVVLGLTRNRRHWVMVLGRFDVAPSLCDHHLAPSCGPLLSRWSPPSLHHRAAAAPPHECNRVRQATATIPPHKRHSMLCRSFWQQIRQDSSANDHSHEKAKGFSHDFAHTAWNNN